MIDPSTCLPGIVRTTLLLAIGLAGAFTLAGCRAGPGALPWVQALDYADADLVPVDVRGPDFPFVTVEINDERVELLFDTGNMTGLFLASAVVTRLDLPAVGQVHLSDADGRPLGTARRLGIAELRAFGRAWHDVEAVERSAGRLSGAIGPPYLLGRRFTLDVARGWLAVTDAAIRPLPAADGELPLVPVPDLPGLIVLRGSVHGRDVLMQVDTGKSRTCIDPDLAEALGLAHTVDGYRIDALAIGGSHFSIPSAKALRFGGISRGLPEPIRLGVGADVLRSLVLTVDYDRGVARVQGP